MKYVIFGAGSYGELALDFLGYLRVLCFADNYAYGKELRGKKIISFGELKELSLEELIIEIGRAHF